MVLVVQEVQVGLEVQAGKLDINPLGLLAVAQEFQADQVLLICQAGLNLHLLLAGQGFPVGQEDNCSKSHIGIGQLDEFSLVFPHPW